MITLEMGLFRGIALRRSFVESRLPRSRPSSRQVSVTLFETCVNIVPALAFIRREERSSAHAMIFCLSAGVTGPRVEVTAQVSLRRSSKWVGSVWSFNRHARDVAVA